MVSHGEAAMAKNCSSLVGSTRPAEMTQLFLSWSEKSAPSRLQMEQVGRKVLREVTEMLSEMSVLI